MTKKIKLTHHLTKQETKKAIQFGTKRTTFGKPLRLIFVLMFALLAFQFFVNLFDVMEVSGNNRDVIMAFLVQQKVIVIALVFFFIFPPLFSLVAAHKNFRDFQNQSEYNCVELTNEAVIFLKDDLVVQTLKWSQIETVYMNQVAYLFIERKTHRIMPVEINEKKRKEVAQKIDAIIAELYQDGVKLEFYSRG